MAEFAYRAMDQHSRWLRGRVRAANEIELDRRLRDRGLDLIDCKTIKMQSGLLILSRGISSRDLVRLCVHLEQMEAAGVPVLESLAEARDSMDSARLQDVLTEIHRDVNEGVPLSAGFGVHSGVFSSVFTSLIAAGEETGNLADSFRELVKHLKWVEEMKAKIKKATRYPAILAVVMLGTIMFMMTIVVPQVVEMLKFVGHELPLETRALIAVSEFFQNYWYLIIIVSVGLYVLIRAARRVSADFALQTDYLLLRVPVIGPVIKKISLARFAQIFAVTFRSGIEVLACLEAAKRMVNNRSLRQAVEVVHDRVQAGDPLSSAMQTAGEFPPMVVHMVRVGEATGKLENTLLNVAEFYDRDVDESIQAMIAMIEPALIVLLGGMMAWIALAVFGPLYDSLGALGV